ncbi:MAG: hypothetical protein HYZ51_02785, partial [Candidatus Doudnabacteria bacterium]|nr:hypothetical protein [Candidatus Doudnabacteria bacterium]
LNGQPVRLLDIIDLVLKSNIGTSRYTVIGQGTIDQMILAGPQEVKSLLDEASGVKTYYMRREKTLRRLEQTAQNLMRAEDLIAEIAPRLRSLRRQAKRMEDRTVVEQELKIYQREYFGKTYWNLKGILDKFLTELGILEARKNSVQNEFLVLEKKAETEETDKSGLFGKFTEIQEELGKLQDQKNKLLEDLSMVRGKMQSQKTTGVVDAKTLQLEMHQLKSKEQELELKIAAAEKDETRQKQELKQASSDLAELNAHLGKLYEFLQNPNTVDWEGFNLQLAILENSLNDFYAKINSGKPWEEVRLSIESFKGSFVTFKGFVTKSFRNPAAAANLQHELKRVIRAKEELTIKVQDLELGLAKSKVTLDFLRKEKQEASQETFHLGLEMKKTQSGGFDAFIKELISEEDRIKKEAEQLTTEISRLGELFKQEQLKQEKKQKSLHETESNLRKKQEELSKIKDEISRIQIDKAKVDTQNEVLREEVLRILGEAEYQVIREKNPSYTPPLAKGGGGDLESKIMKLRQQLDTIGGMDELTLKEYQETESRYQTLGGQIEDLKKSMQDLRGIMDELDEQIKVKFNHAFHKINEKFEHYFRILFNGGRAYLSLIKAQSEQVSADASFEDKNGSSSAEASEDLRPEEKIVQKYEKGGSNIIGIDMKATPPGKKLSVIQALSGGERSLTSIALLCSLLSCYPSPFVVLDEVDAALDDANTIRFAQILSSLASTTQFVTITHNRETMAHANILYGVTMGEDGVSKLLSVKLDQAKQFAK